MNSTAPRMPRGDTRFTLAAVQQQAHENREDAERYLETMANTPGKPRTQEFTDMLVVLDTVNSIGCGEGNGTYERLWYHRARELAAAKHNGSWLALTLYDLIEIGQIADEDFAALHCEQRRILSQHQEHAQ